MENRPSKFVDDPTTNHSPLMFLSSPTTTIDSRLSADSIQSTVHLSTGKNVWVQDNGSRCSDLSEHSRSESVDNGFIKHGFSNSSGSHHIGSTNHVPPADYAISHFQIDEGSRDPMSHPRDPFVSDKMSLFKMNNNYPSVSTTPGATLQQRVSPSENIQVDPRGTGPHQDWSLKPASAASRPSSVVSVNSRVSPYFESVSRPNSVASATTRGSPFDQGSRPDSVTSIVSSYGAESPSLRRQQLQQQNQQQVSISRKASASDFDFQQLSLNVADNNKAHLSHDAMGPPSSTHSQDEESSRLRYYYESQQPFELKGSEYFLGPSQSTGREFVEYPQTIGSTESYGQVDDTPDYKTYNGMGYSEPLAPMPLPPPPPHGKARSGPSTSTHAHDKKSGSGTGQTARSRNRHRPGPASGAPPVNVVSSYDGFVYKVQFKRSQHNFLRSAEVDDRISPGDFVMVEADRGEDLGVVYEVQPLQTFFREGGSLYNKEKGVGMGDKQSGVKHILRHAQAHEYSLLPVKMAEEQSIVEVCRERALGMYGLPMTVSDAEYQFDRHKLTIFYESQRRIDFRELVRDLFGVYKARIWMEHVDYAFRPHEGAARALANGSPQAFSVVGQGKVQGPSAPPPRSIPSQAHAHHAPAKQNSRRHGEQRHNSYATAQTTGHIEGRKQHVYAVSPVPPAVQQQQYQQQQQQQYQQQSFQQQQFQLLHHQQKHYQQYNSNDLHHTSLAQHQSQHQHHAPQGDADGAVSPGQLPSPSDVAYGIQQSHVALPVYATYQRAEDNPTGAVMSSRDGRLSSLPLRSTGTGTAPQYENPYGRPPTAEAASRQSPSGYVMGGPQGGSFQPTHTHEHSFSSSYHTEK